MSPEFALNPHINTVYITATNAVIPLISIKSQEIQQNLHNFITNFHLLFALCSFIYVLSIIADKI